jgi:hypothetical protein
VRQILLDLNRLNLGRFWEQPTGAAYRGDRLIKYGLIGCADITGITTYGVRVEIEVKTGKATQSEGQVRFEAMIKKMGGIYCVALSSEDAIECLKIVAAIRDGGSVKSVYDPATISFKSD